MPLDSFFSFSSSSAGRRRQHSGGDAEERLIPFPARSHAEPSAPARRRRDLHDLERGSAPRRVRRRRQGATPWLQRNALSIAAVSILVAVIGLGFGLLQTINRSESSPALLATGQGEPTAAVSASAATASSPAQAGIDASPTAVVEVRREIQSSVKVLEPGYTVAAGDTLGVIAVKFSTTVERIQALNNLSDPRALRIGTKLVIPPPL